MTLSLARTLGRRIAIGEHDHEIAEVCERVTRRYVGVDLDDDHGNVRDVRELRGDAPTKLRGLTAQCQQHGVAPTGTRGRRSRRAACDAHDRDVLAELALESRRQRFDELAPLGPRGAVLDHDDLRAAQWTVM